MPDRVKIGVVGFADLDEIARLEAACFTFPWRREFFESELTMSGRFNLVARRGATLVGYLFAMWLFDEMHVNKIAVTEGERRQGIARDLMGECQRFAHAHAIRSISLEVRQSNAPAQDFYRSLDFVPVYVRPRYYPDGEAAVVMARQVGAASSR
jgi:ribosomal-protein-alanine N-acetyltransferase